MAKIIFTLQVAFLTNIEISKKPCGKQCSLSIALIRIRFRAKKFPQRIGKVVSLAEIHCFFVTYNTQCKGRKIVVGGDCERLCFDQLNAHVLECLLFFWRSKIKTWPFAITPNTVDGENLKKQLELGQPFRLQVYYFRL